MWSGAVFAIRNDAVLRHFLTVIIFLDLEIWKSGSHMLVFYIQAVITALFCLPGH